MEADKKNVSPSAACNQSPKREWIAIYTQSRAEKRVRDYLTEQGFEAYVPIRKELHKWSDRKKLVEVPIIHSYCFVCLDVNSEREKTFAAPGYVGVMCRERKPVVIPQSEIETMRRTVDSMLDIEVENRLLRVGKMVRILSGPMEGAIGRVEDLSTKRVHILLKSIGVTMTIKLDDDVHFETIGEGEAEE